MSRLPAVRPMTAYSTDLDSKQSIYFKKGDPSVPGKLEKLCLELGRAYYKVALRWRRGRIMVTMRRMR